MDTTSAFLAALDADERTRLLAGAETRHFKAGDSLLVLGCEGSSMFFIQEGQVVVTVRAKGDVVAIELDRATVWGMLADGDSAAVKVLQAITATVCERLEDVNVKVQEEVVRPRGNVFKRLFSSVFGRS